MLYGKYEIKGDVRPKGNGFEIRCRNLNKDKVSAPIWHPDPEKSEQENAEDLQLAVLNWKKLNKGTITHDNRAFGDVAADRLEHIGNKRAVGTVERYKDCTPRIIAEFGNCPIRSIQAYQIQSFIDKLMTRPRSKTMPKSHDGRKQPHPNEPLGWKSADSHRTYISNVFNYAIRFKMASENPCSKVELPPKEEADIEIYTAEEAGQVLDALYREATANDARWRHIFLYYFILAAFLTGARTGELLGLSWGDVTNNRVAIIKQSKHVRGKGAVDVKTKSRRSVRVIKDIPSDFFNALAEFREIRERISLPLRKMNIWGDSDKIFCSETGNAICPTLPRKWFYDFCIRNNLRYVNPHGCRHLNISLRLRCGEDIVSTAAKSGHDVNVMLSRYAHFIDDGAPVASAALNIFSHRGGNLGENKLPWK